MAGLRPVRCDPGIDFVTEIVQVSVCVIGTRTGEEPPRGLRRGRMDLTELWASQLASLLTSFMPGPVFIQKS